MPINFAMALDPLIQAPQFQGMVAGTLANIDKMSPNSDSSGGRMSVAVKGGIDPRPGTPSISDKNIAFALNEYYDEQAPGAECKMIIEVLIDQKYYQVVCVRTDAPGNTAWTPSLIRDIAEPKDFRKMTEADAKRLHEMKAPPRPINVPDNMPANPVLSGPRSACVPSSSNVPQTNETKPNMKPNTTY